MTVCTHGIQKTLEQAAGLIASYTPIAKGLQRAPRGIHHSEGFFLYATLGSYRPKQIIESGRAQGQSTYLLSQCFPSVSVVSIEYDDQHPDAQLAVSRLASCPNVSCLFGDANKVLPELTLDGDVVVIDGPKDLSALRLALRVMQARKPAFIFIHDANKGTPLRNYLEKHVPHAFFSDHPDFVSAYSYLDSYLSEEDRAPWQSPSHCPESLSYACTFACIPYKEGFPGNLELPRLFVTKKVRKHFRAKQSEVRPCFP